MTTTDITPRLLAKVERDYMTGCLRWTGHKTTGGYAQIRVNGRRQPVHRVAHELWVGPIPEGMEIDHVHAAGCRWKDCVEPSHLEAVTRQENMRRRFALITHCPQGHPYDAANTRITLRRCGRASRAVSTRNCRACDQAQARSRRAKRQAKKENV